MNHAELIKRLEAERHDISYRKQPAATQPQVVVKEVKRVPERLKKIYFHAGRFSAGDRDTLAVEAKAQFDKLENAALG